MGLKHGRRRSEAHRGASRCPMKFVVTAPLLRRMSRMGLLTAVIHMTARRSSQRQKKWWWGRRMSKRSADADFSMGWVVVGKARWTLGTG